MRLLSISSTVAMLAAIASCDPADRSVPTEQSNSGMVSASANANAPDAKNFVTHLSGDNEVPARPTQAQGELKMQLSKDGLSLDYRIISSNISNVTASHIHLGAEGVNGPVVVFFYGNAPAGGGRTDGVLASGTITAANFVGPLAGHPFGELISALRSGGAYANVHTNDGVAPTNTGAGDFPGGEIRGQIRTAGPE